MIWVANAVIDAPGPQARVALSQHVVQLLSSHASWAQQGDVRIPDHEVHGTVSMQMHLENRKKTAQHRLLAIPQACAACSR